MPFQKGRVKTGGRKKGSVSKATREAQERFNELISGQFPLLLTPLQVMQIIMQVRIEQADFDGALVAAEKAAPYVHARLNATDVRVQHSVAGKSDAEVAAEIEALRTKLEASRSLQPPTIEGSAEPIEVSGTD
jgi:hypothetical protein